MSVYQDSIPEHDERFIVWLSDPIDVVLGNNLVWATFLNNDVPTVSVGDVTVSESSGSAEFTVSLHAPGVKPASIDYTTAVMTATLDEDYTAVSGTLDIPADTTSVTISVPIIGDAVDEPDEMFQLVLSNPELLAMGDAVGVGTITDDDGWTINDPSPWEYAGTMAFNVERDHTSTAAVTVNYQVAAAGSAVGGASCSTDGVDYETPPGSVTLQPADTTATITITITLCDDTEVEGRETLLIELTGVPGRKLTGVGTITSDD